MENMKSLIQSAKENNGQRRWYDKFLHIFTHLEGSPERDLHDLITYWDCRVCGEWMRLRGTFTVVAPEDEL